MSFGAYQRGLSLIESRTLIGADDEPVSSPESPGDELSRLGREELVILKKEKFPQRFWGVALIDDGTYKGLKVEKFFSMEGGKEPEGSDWWYSQITNDPKILYAATWDLWGSTGGSQDTDSPPTGEADNRNVFKSEQFAMDQSRYSEPVPPGSQYEIVSTQPSVKVTAEIFPDEGVEDEYEESGEGSASGPSAAMLAIGALAVVGGVVLGSKGKKRSKARV